MPARLAARLKGVLAFVWIDFAYGKRMREDFAFRGKRLFIAIELPDYVRTSLCSLRGLAKGFHWVDPERYHLTLKFIGDIPGQFQKEIEQALDRFDVGHFILPIKGVGRFPERGKAHAVWAGVGTGHPRLFQLQKRIDDALFNIGIEPERRRYCPHITLARVNQASDETVRQYVKRTEMFEAAPFHVERFHLFRSETAAGRRVHVREKTWELRTSDQLAS